MRPVFREVVGKGVARGGHFGRVSVQSGLIRSVRD